MAGAGEDHRFTWGEHWCVDETSAEVAANPLELEAEARYSALRRLGAGGCGEVILVRDDRLGRQVAYKRLSSAGAQQRVDRFGREVWVTAQLEHPGIVPLYDAGVREDGALYYTMRYIRGRSLREALSNCGGLDARLRLLGHFADACHAAAYAHSRAVVHRDLKPDNIMVGEFGETQVVDWGMAAVRGEVPEGGPAREVETWDTHLTVAGAVIGTPAYMSPEQARGEAADERSDVWGLGAILYEILTGQRPYEEGGPEGLLARLRSGAPISRADALEPAAPPELVAVASRALEWSPAARYASARELAAEVDHYLHGRRVGAYDYSPGELLLRLVRRWRAPLAVAAVATAALVMLGAGAWRNVQQERTRAVAAEAETRLHLADSLAERARDAAAVDARQEAEQLAEAALALVEDPEARGVLARFGAAERPAPAGRWSSLEGCRGLALAPDGERLACIEDGAVSMRTLEGAVLWREAVESPLQLRFVAGGLRVGLMGEAQLRDSDTGRLRVSARSSQPISGLSPLGTWYWEGVQETLRLMAPDKSPASLLTRAPCRAPAVPERAAFAPDESSMAVSCSDGAILVSAPPGAPARALEADHHVAGLRYSPDGARLLSAGYRGEFLVLDVATGATLQTLRGPTTAPALTAWSPDGRRVAALDDVGGAWLWDAVSGQLLARLTAGIGGPMALGFTPDSAQLRVFGDEGRAWALPERWAPTALSRAAGISCVTLSPDGRWIATAHGDGELAVWDARTGEQVASLRWQELVNKYAAFSPDGRWLASSGIGEAAIKVFAVGTWEEVASLESDVPGLSYRRVGFTPDSGQVFGGIYGKGLIAWSTDDWSLAERLSDRGLDLMDLYAPAERGALYGTLRDGELLAIGEGDGLLGRQVGQVSGRAAVDPARGRLAMLEGDLVRVLEGGQEQLTWSTDDHRPLDLALSPDGRWAATAGMDRTVRIWSLTDGALRAVLRGHRERVVSLEFSADGQRLLSGSWDGTARIWDMSALDRPVGQAPKR